MWQQQINISKFVNITERLGKHLQVIDGDAYRRIYPLIQSKANTLWAIKFIMENERFPLFSPDEKELKELINISSTILDDDERADSSLFGDIHTKNVDIKSRLNNESLHFPIASVDTQEKNSFSRYSITWSKETQASIKKYLRSKKPKKELENIKIIADQIRNALEKHFSISDILLGIGDKEFDY